MKLYKGNKGRNMLSFIRKRVTYANVVMTFALVFAMSGGAYAAKKYLITSTKQISPKVLKQLQGKTGPAGATGSAGTAGAAGKEGPVGKAGTNGTSGLNGKSVVVAEVKTGEPACKLLGGASFEVEGASKKFFACNGENGTSGSGVHLPKTLASGDSLTGIWATGSQGPVLEKVTVTPETKEIETEVKGVKEKVTVMTGVVPVQEETKPIANVAISFPIPLAKQPKVAVQFERGTPAGVLLENKAEKFLSGAAWTTPCGGTFAKPTAAGGYLCVYLNEGVAPTNDASLVEEGHEFGALIPFTPILGVSHATGSWAVTAE
jgi:hypothetical protein